MTDDKEVGRALTAGEALAEYSRRRVSDTHPSEERLTAYYERRLVGAEMDLVRNHVVHCSECAAFLIDLDDLLRPAEPGEVGGGGKRDQAPLLVVPGDRKRPAATDRRLRLWRLAASILLVTTLGLGTTVSLLLASRSSPRSDVFLVADLRPQQRDRGEQRAHQVPDWAHQVLVLLNVPEQRSERSFEAVIRNAHGDVLWRGSVRQTPQGSFALLIPLSALPDATHNIELLGVSDDGTQELLSTYRLDLYPPEPR